MPVATRESLQNLLGLVAEHLTDYLKSTPVPKQRAAKLTLIRRLCHQCGIGSRHEVTPKTAKMLAKLYESYVAALAKKVNDEDCKSGIIGEAGRLLRANRITAQSIDEQRGRSKVPSKLSVVPNQSLPFNVAGERVQ